MARKLACASSVPEAAPSEAARTRSRFTGVSRLHRNPVPGGYQVVGSQAGPAVLFLAQEKSRLDPSNQVGGSGFATGLTASPRNRWIAFVVHMAPVHRLHGHRVESGGVAHLARQRVGVALGIGQPLVRGCRVVARLAAQRSGRMGLAVVRRLPGEVVAGALQVGPHRHTTAVEDQPLRLGGVGLLPVDRDCFPRSGSSCIPGAARRGRPRNVQELLPTRSHRTRRSSGERRFLLV